MSRDICLRCLEASQMRMRGLEPPRTCIHTDLNRARLPIPPHPRANQQRRYRTDATELSCWHRAQLRRSFGSVDGDGGGVDRVHSASFGSLASCAAIVQGTRTPPSHGGNPGSNPGSGTRTNAPELRGVLLVWGSAQWPAAVRLTHSERTFRARAFAISSSGSTASRALYSSTRCQ
jgi:hypothetical protein